MRSLALSILLLALTGCPSGGGKTVKAKPNPAGGSAINAGSRSKLKASMMGVLKAAKVYKATKGEAPETMQDLVDAELLPAKSTQDLWGNEYVIDSSEPTLRIVTYGADGAEGGTGADKDWSTGDL
jgi:hypothetical protein